VAVVEFKSVYGVDALRARLPQRAHVTQVLLGAYMLHENTGVVVDRVTLVYTTNRMAVEIYDYPYHPPTIPWQRDCILAWAESVADGCMYVDAHCAAWAEDVFSGALANKDTGLALHARLHGWAVVPGPLQYAAWKVHTATCHYKPAGGAITAVGRLHHIPNTGAQLLRRPGLMAAQIVPLVVPPRRSLRLAGQYQQTTTAAAVVAASAAGRRLYPTTGHDALRKAVNARVKTWAAAQDVRGIDPGILAAQLAVRFGPSSTPGREGIDNTVIITRAIHRAVNDVVLERQQASESQYETLVHLQQRGLLTAEGHRRCDAAFDAGVKERVRRAIRAARIVSGV